LPRLAAGRFTDSEKVEDAVEVDSLDEAVALSEAASRKYDTQPGSSPGAELS
jgi:hypothetical protein